MTDSGPHSRIAFLRSRVFDGEAIRPGQLTVLVEDGLITGVDEGRPAPEGFEVIDLAGRTLMPGLIDAHFHCNSPDIDVARADAMSPSLMAQYARTYLEDALDRGFTTVRDAAGADAGLVQAIEKGLIRGPRLYVSGQALSQSGGHGDFETGFQICDCHGYSGYLTRVVDGVDEVRRQVRRTLRQGAHHIKLMMSGGILSPTDPIWMDQFSDEEVRAAVEETARKRAYVMAHALNASSVRRCAALGVRSIEHGFQVDAETAAVVASSPSFLVPTLSIINALSEPEAEMPDWAREKALVVVEGAFKAVEECVRAGVKLGFGTDLIGAFHGRESNEFLLRGRVSPPLSVLRSATSINAELMMLAGEIGVVRPGARADLIVVDGDPLADLHLLAEPSTGLSAVMKDGHFVRRSVSLGDEKGR